MIQGHVYHFNHPTGHPFRLSTTADGTHGGGVEYTSGVHVRGDNILELRTDENTPFNYITTVLYIVVWVE